jgi:hypothetical protein
MLLPAVLIHSAPLGMILGWMGAPVNRLAGRTEEKNRLLKKYWTIPDRQVETSVVLAEVGG